MTVSAVRTTTPHQCLATKDVLEVLRISRATLYRMLAAGELPPPIKIGFTKNVWLRSDIDAFLATRIAARDGAFNGLAVASTRSTLRSGRMPHLRHAH